MYSAAKEYFQHLDMVREDIREEFDIIGIQSDEKRSCDFGCGKGITTFGLTLEAKESQCVGLDLFGEGNDTTPAIIHQYVAAVEAECKQQMTSGSGFQSGL